MSLVQLKKSWDTMSLVDRDVPEELAKELPSERDREKTTTLTIDGEEVKYVEVGIVPIVDYLNNFPSIGTIESCNGHNAYCIGNLVFHETKPYVIFKCSDLDLIEWLIEAFNPTDIPNVNIVFCRKSVWALDFYHIAALEVVKERIVGLAAGESDDNDSR